MQIPINAILYQLSTKLNFESQNTDLGRFCCGLKLFNEEADDTTEVFDADYLYMISEKKLRSWSASFFEGRLVPACPFLCISPNRYLKLDQFDPELSLIVIYTEESFSVMFNQLTNVFHSFFKWNQEFHLALLKKLPLQALLTLSQDYLVHPMIIMDRHYSLLGHVAIPGCSDPIMDDILAAGYVTPQTMNRLRQDQLISASEDAENPLINYYCQADKKCYYSMMYRFYSNNHIVGYALIFRCAVHPKTNYYYLMNLFAENLQLYFQQERYQSRSSSEMYESLFCEIMEHPEASGRQYEEQISYIPGLSSMEGRFQLARIDYQNHIELPFSFACWNLRNSIPQLKPFVYQNQLYVLRSLSCEEDFSLFLADDERQLFCRSFHGYPFFCGVSCTFFSLMDLSTAALQCREALKLGRTRDPLKPTDTNYVFYNFSELHALYFLQELKKQTSMSMIASPCYLVLKQYDVQHGTDLCEVFMQYLTNGRNINQTSILIHMHRNTILNKVKKAIWIMHNDLEDSQMLIPFILSYLNDHIKPL